MRHRINGSVASDKCSARAALLDVKKSELFRIT